MRERPTLFGAGYCPAKPAAPHMKQLGADVALGREILQGDHSHLGLELDIELVQQFGLRLEISEE